MINNIAFDFLRKHKKCSPETEELVMKRLGRSLNQSELINVFENGVSGLYGKLYEADVQTLLGWVDDFRKGQQTPANYLQSGLLDPNVQSSDQRFFQGITLWHKEVNKCFASFKSGGHHNFFHPFCYDRLVLDGKLKSGELKMHWDDEGGITKAKQIKLSEFFNENRRFENIYHV